MKIKFNRFERIAGIFVLTAFVGTIAVFISVAIKQGWFESKIAYKARIETAGGIFPGTEVFMSGIRIGYVESVELESKDKILIEFSIGQKYTSKIREDSVVHALRSFIIGDKYIEVTMGDSNKSLVKEGTLIPSETSFDIMDLLNGRRLGPHLDTFMAVLENLKEIMSSFADPKRSGEFIKIFDQLEPALRGIVLMSGNVGELTNQLTRKKNLQKAVSNLVETTRQLNYLLPEASKIVRSSPELGQNFNKIVSHLSELTEEMTKLIPTISAIAPELPKASKRAIEAMNEAVIVLKAMQRSFLLKGAVKEVMKEEEKRQRLKEEERLPAYEW